MKKLEPGTVVFEDISITRYKGHVIKALNAPRSLNNSGDGHLTGMIEYQGKTDTHEVLFGDRDTEDDIILQQGDVVEFNVSTGSDNLQLFNPLSANPTKWSNTLKKFVSLFDHFLWLMFKGVNYCKLFFMQT